VKLNNALSVSSALPDLPYKKRSTSATATFIDTFFTQVSVTEIFVDAHIAQSNIPSNVTHAATVTIESDVPPDYDNLH